jgi:mannose-6-phosphate isomerase-like protein (cupin superfamily)
MNGYIDNIEKLSLENNNFRKVLYTAQHSQLVVMAIVPGGEIGMEVHPDQDQFLRVERGTGKAVIDGVEHALEDGSAVIVPAGAQHNIVNASSTEPLKLYTLYSPPHHRDGVVHETKEATEADNEEFDGKTTE